MQNTDNKIYFNFSYFALRLLGKGLYSNHWTAIAELVANGLDAQATSVKIYINMVDHKHSTIEIFDNGSGMDYHDLAEKYVLIGKDKREDSEIDDEIKKQLMGRKGIGKLAALFLSNKYYLITKKRGNAESAWCLDASLAKDSDIPRLDKCDVESINIESKEEWDNFTTGTMIRLTDVDLTNFGIKTIEGFKARLSDFYLTDSERLQNAIETCILFDKKSQKKFEPIEKSIAFKNFYVFFNNTGKDYESLLKEKVFISSQVESIAEKKRDVIILDSDKFAVKGKRQFLKPDGTLTENELFYEMKGWIGLHTSIKKDEAIVNDPDYLRNKAYRPNQLRLYVRNKLAVENFLEYVKNTQAFANYIEGEISFDILDDNELGDIATSNRQGFIEDDERVVLLIEILKPILNALIRARVKIGTTISEEEKIYHEEERLKEEAKKLEAEEAKRKAEEEKKKAVEEKEKAEQEREYQRSRAEMLDINLSSEKKRSNFLMDSLDDGQIEFAKRLHMLKINVSTMEKAIKKNIMLIQRGRYSEDMAMKCLEKMSYLNARMQAVLKYSAAANFNTREEYMTGDLFGFIREYCEKVLVREEELQINVECEAEISYVTKFVPQDIVVILDNVVSNSKKSNSKVLKVILDKNEKIIIDFKDDGRGIDPRIKDVEELFTFGKGYTDVGTGVGLYHIKDIVENKMGGNVSIHSIPGEGFTLQMRL